MLGFSKLYERKRKGQFNPKMMDMFRLRARGAELLGLGARGCPTNMIWGEMLRPLYANTPTTPSTSLHPYPPPTNISKPKLRDPPTGSNK